MVENLEWLSLERCDIGPTGIIPVFEKLTKLKRLGTLRLEGTYRILGTGTTDSQGTLAEVAHASRQDALTASRAPQETSKIAQ
eukprot:scaffold1954_cov268-Pinguiococcus_pyrenoidosus.AAC.167